MYGREGEGEGGGGKKAKAEIAYIPPDLCGEILYRLPSNDLLNCKLVSKEWLRLISSTGFIQKHLERSKADCNDLRIMLPFKYNADIINCANNTSKKITFAHYVLLGLCDGLILYYDPCHHKIAAFNPCSGVMDERIPNPCIKDNMEALASHGKGHREGLIFSWFGHHPTSTGEYALVLANKLEDRIVFNVYTLSRNNINNITALSSSTLELDKNSYMVSHQNIGTLLHGRLHWSAEHASTLTDEPVILVYDFETKEVVRMSPPVQSHWQIVGVVNGCLCAATRAQEVWMMKVYGVEESWTKYVDVEGYRYGDEYRYGNELIALTFSPNGDHLIIRNHCFKRPVRIFKEITHVSVNKYSLRERKRHKERDQNQIKLLKDYTSTTFIELCIACIDSLISPTLLWKELEEEEVEEEL